MVSLSHRPKDSWNTDPLVFIQPDRLRAALLAKSWSIQKLADLTDNHPQTLDHLAKGDRPKRCRMTRRSGLAEALGASEAWLEGREQLIKELMHLPKELTLPLSPRLQLEVGALLRKAATAVRRDFRKLNVVQTRRRNPSISESFAVERLSWYLLRLLRLDLWREQLTTWQRGERDPAAFRPEAPGLLVDHEELYTAEEDAVGLAMVTVIVATLSPWFEGKAELDYDRLRVIVGYDRRGKKNEAPHPLYKGKASTPLNLFPQYALGLPR